METCRCCVVAIDPGPIESGYAVWDTRDEKEEGVKFSLQTGKTPNAELRTWLEDFVPAINPDLVAIEMIASYGMSVGQEVFDTCVEVGRIAQVCEAVNLTWLQVFRRDVKLHICGNVRATDSNIRQALIDRLGTRGTKKAPGPTYGISGDMWAAIGLAITAAETKIILLKKDTFEVVGVVGDSL